MKMPVSRGQLERRLRRWRAALWPPLPAAALFPHDVIVHCAYHKCLTAYFNRIMIRLGDEFGFFFQHYNTNAALFQEAVLNGTGKRVVSVNNVSELPFDRFPNYRGSHFVRDPRDLVISGYHYHLWTTEAWCVNPNFNWAPLVANPSFARYVAPDPARRPQASYQAYLNELAPEKGIILEMILRGHHFEQMQRWDYGNPNIVELRYEDIVGNEAACFAKLFRHYEFHPRLRARGVALAERFSLKNQAKSKTGHVRRGTSKQWQTEFSTLHKSVFKELYPDLLIKLGYEPDAAW